MVRPSVDPETLTELSGEDPPELVSPEHVDDEVGRGVDGQQHVRDGDDLLDRRCGLTGRILLEREGARPRADQKARLVVGGGNCKFGNWNKNWAIFGTNFVGRKSTASLI